MRLLTFLVALLAGHVNAAQIAIIIDDIGNHSRDAAAFQLPTDVTFAILPHKPLSTVFAQRAANQQREVILHMPMESLSRAKQEDELLVSTMQAAEIRQTLEQALQTVPYAIGMNNHMGSRFTQLSLPMSITMEYLSQRGLMFVDSRTTRYSRASSMAKKQGVPYIERHVFLDHDLSEVQLNRQFLRLLAIAKKRGLALGIAHPHAQTLDFLQARLANLATHQVQLVKLSEVLAQPLTLAKVGPASSTTPDTPPP